MNDRMVFFGPVDVWSFRDGKPFEVGEAFEATSIFPPAPWTTLGALRTALLRRSCPNPHLYPSPRKKGGDCPHCGEGPCVAVARIGEPDEPAFSTGPPLPAIEKQAESVEVWFPAPVDLVADQVEGAAPVPRLLRPHPEDEMPGGVAHSIMPLRPLTCTSTGRVSDWRQRWVKGEILEELLAGRIPASMESENGGFFISEPRIGIGMDPSSRAASSGQFYLRDAVRPKNGRDRSHGIAVAVSSDLGLQDEVVRLGGDGHLALVTEHPRFPWPAHPEPIGPRIKLYLCAPTYLRGGWRPEFIDADTLMGAPPGCDSVVKLVALGIREWVAYGGWELARQQPRPMRRLVGAGSVLFFEVEGGRSGDEIVRRFHARPFCDDETMARAGFGMALIGRW